MSMNDAMSAVVTPMKKHTTQRFSEIRHRVAWNVQRVPYKVVKTQRPYAQRSIGHPCTFDIQSSHNSNFHTRRSMRARAQSTRLQNG